VGGEEASVEMIDVSAKGFGSNGLCVENGACVTAAQCEFSKNRELRVIMTLQKDPSPTVLVTTMNMMV
jgi:hypothetical protein